MAANTSQDVSRSGLSHITIRAREINFKAHHMPFTRKCPLRSLARVVSSHILLVPSRTASGWFPTNHLCTCACLQEELIYFLTRGAISEKVRRAPFIEFLWLPSRTTPSAISCAAISPEKKP
ncbi:hypothetical protein TNCV_1535151 [Trichonephila clavipes]|uniref:Uncharacterized protein n=1 Tax=Trichonephila clavipes TaxID=2585209 RepID=A0A8X6V029_TRICX|nr:hypothetical protein TNCV_1535151 [Trichonephila clavipes]